MPVQEFNTRFYLVPTPAQPFAAVRSGKVNECEGCASGDGAVEIAKGCMCPNPRYFLSFPNFRNSEFFSSDLIDRDR